jgi:hypothetical protein
LKEQSSSVQSDRSRERPCIVALLKPRLTLAKGLSWPQRAFVVDGKEYRDAGFGEWTGFYDWLRASNGALLGVRYWLDASTKFLEGYARNLPYVSVDPSRCIEVYFSDQRAFEPKLSADQAFLYDALFRAADGEYAIAFGAEELSGADFEILEQSGMQSAEARV